MLRRRNAHFRPAGRKAGENAAAIFGIETTTEARNIIHTKWKVEWESMISRHVLKIAVFKQEASELRQKKVETEDVSGDSELLEVEEMELISVRQEAQLIVNVED